MRSVQPYTEPIRFTETGHDGYLRPCGPAALSLTGIAAKHYYLNCYNNMTNLTPMPHLHIDRRTPVYYQLYEALKHLLFNGQYTSGDRFLTEKEVEATFHVSRVTARLALERLVREGYVMRQRGQGTFVARSYEAFDAKRLSSFTQDMASRGLKASARILEFGYVPPSGNMERHFGKNVQRLLKIIRLRLADEEAVAIQTCYLPERLAFPKERLGSGSLYALLAQDFGVAIAGADEIIMAKAASEEQAGLLSVPVGAPLLYVERYTFAQTGEAVEYAEIFYRADHYRFYVRQTGGS
jgi:GntR family transcriptional regulator